jgi:hypothetical protein
MKLAAVEIGKGSSGEAASQRPNAALSAAAEKYESVIDSFRGLNKGSGDTASQAIA